MNVVPHIPVLRRGRPYVSLDQSAVKDHRSGEILATVSAANAGIIRRKGTCLSSFTGGAPLSALPEGRRR